MKQKSVAATAKADPRPGLNRTAAPAKRDDLGLTKLLEDLKTHKPTTGILAKTKAAIADKRMLDIVVTQAMAIDLLSTNVPENRDVKQRSVVKHFKSMIDDNFEDTGETYQMNTRNHLVNGQHRLLAIALSGRAQRCYIKCGVSKRAIAALDSNVQRNSADALKISGVRENPIIVAATIKAYMVWKKNQTANVRNTRYGNEDVVDWAGKNHDLTRQIIEASEYALKTLHKQARFLKESQWSFIYFLLSTGPKRQAKAKDFVTKLASGADIGEHNDAAIYFCRKALERFQEDSKSTSPQGAWVVYIWKLKTIIKAWNLWIEGLVKVTAREMRLNKEEHENAKLPTPL